MADVKISQLIDLPVAEGNDILPIVDTSEGETKRIFVSNLMGTPGPIGAITPGTGDFTTIQLATGTQVNEISTDTDLGDSDNALPTQNAVKSYVDTQISEFVSVNPINVYGDSTAIAGDVVLVDTTAGNVTITLIESPKGQIVVKKISPDANQVLILPSVGTIDGDASRSLITYNQSETIVTNTLNFYII